MILLPVAAFSTVVAVIAVGALDYLAKLLTGPSHRQALAGTASGKWALSVLFVRQPTRVFTVFLRSC